MGAANSGNDNASRKAIGPQPDTPPGMLTRIDESDLPDESARQLWRWWQASAERGAPPRREDFEPTEVPQALPGITIFDVERDPLRFRVRIVGTRIAEATGRDTTGVYLDQLENAEAIIARARWAAENRHPYFVPLSPVTWTSKKFRHYATLALPLVDDAGRTCMILYYMSFS